MKKLYLKPSTKVICLRTCGMLAYSNENYVKGVNNEVNITFEGNGFDETEKDF